MNENTYAKLEYEKIIDLLVNECSADLTKEKARELKPVTERKIVEMWQEETSEGVLMRRMEPNIPLGGIIDIRNVLRKIEIGGMPEEFEFLQIMDVLRASRRLRVFLSERKKNYETPHLSGWGGRLTALEHLEKTIDSTIAPEGMVRDSASNTLFNLRRKMNTLRGRIKEKLDNLLRSETAQKCLQDNLVTIRSERYVVPVKQEYRSQIPGIVHDQSASGATLFIEPLAVVEINNELRKTQLAERDEVIRILEELSAKIAPYVEDIRNNLEVLTEIDFIFAKARLSEKMDAISPKMLDKPAFKIVKGRHPLIAKDKVVPLSVNLGLDYTVIVVTGPNTGGKTVTLKTAGLFVLMHQAGLHLPCEVGSAMGIFKGVYADIGDEQSIEQSLSTFSSHITNIIKILDEVNNKSLVLLDELGAGTDPSEGAALAMAVLEYLKSLDAKIIATTHYGDLKTYAFNEPGVENASVEFDIETLRPTYRLMVGVPGKSNALNIASRLGLKQSIINHARSYVSQEEHDVTDLIQSLESSNILAEKKHQEAEENLRLAEAELAKLRSERAKLAENNERVKKRAQEEAAQIIRRAKDESEQILKEMREIKAQAILDAQSEQKGQELKKKLQDKADSLHAAANQAPKILENKVTKVTIGQEVYVPRFETTAEVVTLPNKKGELKVISGIMQMSVNINELQTVEKTKKAPKRDKGTIRLVNNKTADIKNEIDLRGMTVEEACDLVDKYLDDAYLSSLAQVHIIHGKGTGALRSAISDMLRYHPHVKSYRLGNYNEGGNGITVVELKK